VTNLTSSLKFVTGGSLWPAASNPVARRSRRVMLLVFALALFNAFDLALTLLAHQSGYLDELNPLARWMLYHPVLVVIFKLSAVGLALVILIRFRHHSLVEFCCWCLCGVYVSLAMVWVVYLRHAGHAMAMP
jgi:hypothetical protein